MGRDLALSCRDCKRMLPAVAVQAHGCYFQADDPQERKRFVDFLIKHENHSLAVLDTLNSMDDKEYVDASEELDAEAAYWQAQYEGGKLFS